MVYMKRGIKIKKLAGVRRFASELSGVNGQMPSCCNSSYCQLTPGEQSEPNSR